jgi:hypothetical protein
MAYDPRFTGGVHVASGDVDGDGLPDIITGAGAGGGPHVQVFSGVDNHVIRSFMAYDPRFTGGVFVATSRSNRRLAGSPPASSGDQGVGTAPSSPGTPLGGKTVALLSTGLTPVASDSGISVLVPDTSALTLNPARRLRRTGDRLTEYYDLALGVLTA